jgi:hypothetical protein
MAPLFFSNGVVNMRIAERFSELAEPLEPLDPREEFEAPAAGSGALQATLLTNLADFVKSKLSLAEATMNSQWDMEATDIAHTHLKSRLNDRSQMNGLLLNSLTKTTKLYMMQMRDMQRMESITDMLVACMLATCFFTAMSPYVGTFAGALTIGLVALVLIFVLVRTVRSWSLRRHDDWSKLYHSKDIKPDNAADPDVLERGGVVTPPGTCGR